MPKTTRKVSHIHKLKKHKYVKTGNSIFFCILPDCHYKIEAALALGKETICNHCGETCIMTERMCQLTRPHCSSCGKVKVKNEDGSYGFKKKVATHILDNVSLGSVQDLRARLDSAVGVAEDDDI